MRAPVELSSTDLRHLEGLWSESLQEAYEHYSARAAYQVALAAALVEAGIILHGLGRQVASPRDLLLGDLCLARASRLLAQGSSRQVQIDIATAIEQVTEAAASWQQLPTLRQLLTNVIEAKM